jgi:hypothetical protein
MKNKEEISYLEIPLGRLIFFVNKDMKFVNTTQKVSWQIILVLVNWKIAGQHAQ